MPYTYEYEHPAVAVDLVIGRVRDGRPEVLLIERRESPYQKAWALPGGFVGIDESLEHAARRELHEETGLTIAELTQLHTFGDPDRDPRERVISVVYVGMVRDVASDPVAGGDAAEARWFGLDELPPLAFDHAAMIEHARRFLNGRSPGAAEP